MLLGAKKSLEIIPPVYNYLVYFGFKDCCFQGEPFLMGTYWLEDQTEELNRGDYCFQGEPFVIWSNF